MCHIPFHFSPLHKFHFFLSVSFVADYSYFFFNVSVKKKNSFAMKEEVPKKHIFSQLKFELCQIFWFLSPVPFFFLLYYIVLWCMFSSHIKTVYEILSIQNKTKMNIKKNQPEAEIKYTLYTHITKRMNE